MFHVLNTVPLALKLPCGVYPERIGNASRVHRECIQSAAFLLVSATQIGHFGTLFLLRKRSNGAVT